MKAERREKREEERREERWRSLIARSSECQERNVRRRYLKNVVGRGVYSSSDASSFGPASPMESQIHTIRQEALPVLLTRSGGNSSKALLEKAD